MKRLFSRRYAWLILALLALIALIPTVGFVVHAADPHNRNPSVSNNSTSTSPSLTISNSTVHANQNLTVTANNFASSEMVSIQLDSINSANLATLQCNGQGTCSGTVKMPSTSVIQGSHLLVATGNKSKLRTQIALTFISTVSISPQSGGIGTPVTITGNSFTANETVKIYWGNNPSVYEQTATTDSNGNLSLRFNTPTNVTPGTYPVSVHRLHQSPDSLTTEFRVIAPTMVSTGGIRAGQAVFIEVKNFESFEPVVITWSANTQLQLLTVETDYRGDGSGYTNVPAEPNGTYTLIATGSTSALQATSSLNIGPGITLFINPAGAGSTIPVNGGGYVPSESVHVYFQSPANGFISTTVAANGTFNVSLTVPSTYNASQKYFVYAENASGGEKVRTQFYFQASSLINVCWVCTYGTNETFNGKGFTANDTVNLYVVRGQKYFITSTVADNQGQFAVEATLPSLPVNNGASATLIAISATTNVEATQAISLNAGAILSTGAANIGTKITIKGGNFNASEPVTITFGGKSITSTTTNKIGAFTASFTIPATSSTGYVDVLATGNTSGNSAFASILVMPTITISSTSVASGTPVTVTVTGFASTNSAFFTLNGPNGSESLGSQPISSQGTVSLTFTPSNLISGSTYTVNVYGATINTYVTVSISFTAQ